MGDRKIIKQLPEVLKSSTGRTYGVDMVREAWVRSDQGNKGFARMYGLSQTELEELILLGDWQAARELWRDRMIKTLVKNRVEVLEWRQSLIQQAEFFELMAVESVLNDMAQQVMQKGDLFVRNEQGEVVRDSYGTPLTRTLPEFFKKALEQSQKIREDNLKVLVSATQLKDEPKKDEVLKQNMSEVFEPSEG